MSAFFYIKYHFRKIFAVLLAIWVVVIIGILSRITNVEKIHINKEFYFLVSTSTHIQASTHYVEWNGGAGYLLENSGRTYVVYSVYTKKEDGLAVQTALIDKDTTLLISSIKPS